MTGRCIGEPVSWLRLERRHLGEVGEGERIRIDEHLAACPACAACMEEIRAADASPLPALTLPTARGAARVLPLRRAGTWAAAAGALAAAATLVLALRGGAPDGGRTRPGGSRVKGGAVAFSLVREDGERIDGDSGVYRDGDRFKALVTCPPGEVMSFDLLVYDDGGATFPLEPAARFACGNEVPLQGALRLTGRADETVCLVWSIDGPVPREAIGGGEEQRACKRLSGAEP